MVHVALAVGLQSTGHCPRKGCYPYVAIDHGTLIENDQYRVHCT